MTLRSSLVAATLLWVAVASAATPETPSLELELGDQALSVQDARHARAFDQRDPAHGSFVNGFKLDWIGAENGWAMKMSGTNLVRRDQRMQWSLDRPGVLAVRGRWVEVPRSLGSGGRTLLSGSHGIYTMAEPFRQALESAATDPAAPVPLASLMPDVLAREGRPVSLGVDRQTGGVSLTSPMPGGVDLQVAVARSKREGGRSMGTGTYLRRQAVSGDSASGAGFFDRERFEPRGIELVEPISHRVEEASVSGSFRRQQGYLTVGYESSEFQNHVGELIWDNPFEAGPSVASASDKGRFAQGGVDLWPDNRFHRVHGEGGLRLPGRTRVNASASVGFMKQDDPFLPFTRNEALMFPGPDDSLGTADDVAGTSPSLLPATDLGGEVRTTSTNLRVSGRPVPALGIRAGYRRYEYDDRSPTLYFPGYAAYGESYYRAGVGQKIAGRDTLFSDRGGYTRTTMNAGVSYRFLPAVAADVGFERARWKYDERQVDRTDENVVRAALMLGPLEGASARFSYLDGRRDFDGDYDVGFEGSRLRAFDVWTRDRTRWDGEIDLAGDRGWDVAVSYSRTRDEYPGVVAAPDPLPTSGNKYPSQPYGLNEAEISSFAVTLGAGSGELRASLAAGHDTDMWTSTAVSKTTLANDGDQFDPVNRWVRTQDGAVNWFTLSFSAPVVPDRVKLDCDVTRSAYEGSIETTNPDSPDVNSGVAYDLPDFTSALISSRIVLTWKASRNLNIWARYWYEPYDLRDWTLDSMQPYMQGVITETGDTATEIRSETVSRYLFNDSRYSSYQLNAISCAMDFRF